MALLSPARRRTRLLGFWTVCLVIWLVGLTAHGAGAGSSKPPAPKPAAAPKATKKPAAKAPKKQPKPAAKPSKAAASGKPAASAPPASSDAAAPSSSAPKPAPKRKPISKSERRKELEERLEDLHALARGKLPKRHTIKEVVGLAIDDEKAVRKRILVLLRTLAKPKPAALPTASVAPVAPPKPGKKGKATKKAAPPSSASAAPAPRPAPASSGQHTIEQDLRVAELFLLKQPRERRLKLLKAEADRDAREKSKRNADDSQRSARARAEDARLAREEAEKAAKAARTAAHLAIANALKKTASTLEAQAKLSLTWAKTDKLDAKRSKALATRVDGLHRRVQEAKPDGAENAALYKDVVHAWEDVTKELHTAVETSRAPINVPTYVPKWDDLPHGDADVQKHREKLSAQAKLIQKTAAEMVRKRQESISDHVIATADLEVKLHRARLALLPKLTRAKRKELLGFGSAGVAEFKRELGRLGLAAELYGYRRRQSVKKAGDSHWFVLGLLPSLFWFAVAVSITLWIRARAGKWLESAKSSALRQLANKRLMRWVQTAADVLQSVLRQLIFLGFAVAMRSVLERHQNIREVAVLRYLLLGVAIYRLVLTGIYRTITRLSRQHEEFTEETSERVLGSLRIAGRLTFAMYLALTLAETILGKGYLYRLFSWLAWLGVLPLVFYLIRSWRDDIANAYLRYRDKGALAGIVRKTRTKWYGFFVVVLAVIILLLIVIGSLLRQFVLGFEQTRKALAYVFRKRLERHADAQQRESAVEEALPDNLRSALEGAPDEGTYHPKDYDRALERLSQGLLKWRNKRGMGSMVIAGEPGMGKSTWLEDAKLVVGDVPQRFVGFKERTLTREGLIRTLAEELDAPPECRKDQAALAEWLNGWDKTILFIDDLQLLFMRGVESFGAWRALMELIEITGEQVFWLCALDTLPWEYMTWVRRGQDVFRIKHIMKPWNEDEIAAMLKKRTRDAGYEVHYDDLVVDKMEGVEQEAQMVSTQNEYSRLIWDYSDGVPRVALYCWRQSLVPDGEMGVRVRLFRRPNPEQLEALRGPQRFILASIVWHTSMSESEVVRSLRLGRNLCEDTFERLFEWGVLEREGPRARVTTPWLRVVVRYLKRHHLIE